MRCTNRTRRVVWPLTLLSSSKTSGAALTKTARAVKISSWKSFIVCDWFGYCYLFVFICCAFYDLFCVSSRSIAFLHVQLGDVDLIQSSYSIHTHFHCSSVLFDAHKRMLRTFPRRKPTSQVRFRQRELRV